LWKAFGAATPAALTAPAAEWIGLFKLTDLTNPEWEQQALRTALALSVPFIAAISLWMEGWPKRRLNWITGGLFLCMVALCLYILGTVRPQLGPPSAPELEVVRLQELWKNLFVAAMVFLGMTIAVGILSLPEKQKPRRWPWILVGTVSTLILTVGTYYILRR
jgi:uncharacterized membrane protein AbrB (regulator of aidB expression)